MQLMSDEAQALTREIREETASHLQAILDNVKDAIVTVDDVGHIETYNPTGPSGSLATRPRRFSAGRLYDILLPELGGHADPLRDNARRSEPTSDRGADGRLVAFLERCATKIDDTHVDLAAHQTWGVIQGR